MMEAERYAVSVRRKTIEGDDTWQATVREFPDLMEFGDSREEALDLMLDAIETLIEIAAEEGRDVPAPFDDESDFSGRITLRMPPTLHRKCAQFAESDDTSLNQYIVLLISAAIGAAEQPRDVWKSHAVVDKFTPKIKTRLRVATQVATFNSARMPIFGAIDNPTTRAVLSTWNRNAVFYKDAVDQSLNLFNLDLGAVTVAVPTVGSFEVGEQLIIAGDKKEPSHRKAS